MEMVKLKMRTIYKSFLSIIGFLLFIIIIIGIIYLFYDKVTESDSDIEITGNLSINYLDGKKINVLDNKVLKVSITNSGSKQSYFNISFIKVRGNGSYKIMYEDGIIAEGTLKSIDELTTEYITIDANNTKVYSIEIINDGDTPLTSTLKISNYEGKSKTFADTLLENQAPSENSLTKVGSEIAIEDEGLIKSYDDIGTSYYYRGNVTNNYVYFAGLTWRIVRINGDNTIRLVLDNVADSLVRYEEEKKEEYSYETSSLKEYLDKWYTTNLIDYADYIANTKYCSDLSYDDSSIFNAYNRIITNKIPSLNCLGTSFSSNIATLTIDEVILAGANPTDNNTSYYLYNENISDVWYTMSGAKLSSNTLYMFMVGNNGNILSNVSSTLYRYTRPVINLVKGIEMTGTGTSSDPYRMVEE